MKHLYIISLGGLVLLMTMFFIVATIQANKKFKFEKTAKEMLIEVTKVNHFMSFNEAKDLLNSTKDYVFIDIRNPKEFVGYHIPEALNIPYGRLLDEKYESFFNTGTQKILYGEKISLANAAWMILSQYGYKNLSVLEGEIQNWRLFADTPDIFKDRFNPDETPAFDFAKILEGED